MTVILGIQAGSLFINKEARKWIESTFQQANIPEDRIETAMESFGEEFEIAKRDFVDPSEDVFISLGDRSLSDSKLNMRRGVLTLPG